MMTADDIQKLRQQATAASENPGVYGTDDTQALVADGVLALWVIAEQLHEIRRSLELLHEVVDPGAGENFPGYIRTKDIGR